MPPKKSRFSILSKHLDEEDTSDNLNTKKSIEQSAPSNAKDYLAELGKIISESTESKSFSLEINSIADQFFKRFEFEQQYKNEGTVDEQCMACLQSDFDQGKYILGCKHAFCNQCFNYWSNVTNRCPLCAKISHQILMFLHGKYRVQQLKLNYRPMICQKCKEGNNEFNMYYCDLCRRNCVHIRCEQTLQLKQKKGEEWFCEQCINNRPNQKPRRRKKPRTIESQLDLSDKEETAKFRRTSRQQQKRDTQPQLPRSKRF